MTKEKEKEIFSGRHHGRARVMMSMMRGEDDEYDTGRKMMGYIAGVRKQKQTEPEVMVITQLT